MRSLLITAAVVTAAIALGGCSYHGQQPPVPGPQSSATSAMSYATMHDDAQRNSRHDPRPDPISWFQGTLDEAFSRRPCRCEQPRFRY